MPAFFISFWRTYLDDFRKTIRLSIPVIIGQVGFIMMMLIDNLMIGELGFVHLSAASLANGLFFIITVLGMGVAMAITPLVAEADGAGNTTLAGQYLRQGAWVGVGLGLLLTLICLFTAELLPFMRQPEAEIPLAYDYMQVVAFSIVPLMIFRVGKQFAEGLSLTIPAMLVVLAGLVINVGANWILIYGKFGFPRLELTGAGYGTLFSRCMMMLLMIGYIFFSPRLKKYKLSHGWSRFRSKIMKKILAIGLPSGLQYFFEIGAFVGAAVLIGLMEDGSAQRAAHQIAIQLFALSFMVVTGLSVGATIRVGNARGRKDLPSVRRSGLAGIYLGIAFMIVAAVIFFLGRNWLPTLFVSEERVLVLAAQLMVFGIIFQISDGIQAVAIGILRGIQDVNIPTLLTMIAYWGIALPFGALLGFVFDMQVQGMWIGLVAGLTFASVVLTMRFLALTKSLPPEPDVEQIPVSEVLLPTDLS